MKPKIVSFVTAMAALVLVSTASSQRFEIPDWENAVDFELVASQMPVRPGDAFELALLADIVEGYHLYGPEEQKPSRTEVALEGAHLTVGEPSFPPALTRELEGLGEYDLYEGEIAIRVPVELAASAPVSGQHRASLTVHYQVCTDYACSAPTSQTLSVQLEASGPGAPIEKLHPDIFKSK